MRTGMRKDGDGDADGEEDCENGDAEEDGEEDAVHADREVSVEN